VTAHGRTASLRSPLQFHLIASTKRSGNGWGNSQSARGASSRFTRRRRAALSSRPLQRATLLSEIGNLTLGTGYWVLGASFVAPFAEYLDRLRCSGSLKSDRSQLGGRLPGCARVCSRHDEQFGMLLVPQPSGLGDRVRRMYEQPCLRFVQLRHRLSRRARHDEVGATVKIARHRPVCCSQAQPLPFARPPGGGRERLTWSNTHTPLGRKKSARGFLEARQTYHGRRGKHWRHELRNSRAPHLSRSWEGQGLTHCGSRNSDYLRPLDAPRVIRRS
jgi:hypothetical protein